MELICKYEKKAQILWNWAKPFIERKANRMYGNLYEMSIKAAEAVNDKPLAERLAKELVK